MEFAVGLEHPARLEMHTESNRNFGHTVWRRGSDGGVWRISIIISLVLFIFSIKF